MKKRLVGMLAVGLAVGLLASETWARGPRRGMRRGGAVIRGSRGPSLGTLGGNAGRIRPQTGVRPHAGGLPTPAPSGGRNPAIGSQRPGAQAGGLHSNGLQPGNLRPNRLEPGSPGANFQGRNLGENRRRPGAESFESLFSGEAAQRPTAQQALDNWTSTHPEPFTPAWYWEHPNAWKATHPHADEAAVATAAGLAAWLAVAPYAATSSGGTTVIEETVILDEPEPAETPVEEDVSLEDPQIDTAMPEEWMLLGVYKLLAPGETDATRMIELAVARDGSVGGSHYDRIRNQVDPIQGRADRGTMLLRWTVGQGQTVFEATFDGLTQPEGQILVQLPDGQTARWRLVRVEQPGQEPTP